MTKYRTLTDYRPLVRLDNGKSEPRQKWADDGAVAQQGSKAIKECECGAKVVWLKSKRTGRSYLAECCRYHTESGVEKWYYVGHQPHTVERCDQRVAARTAQTQVLDDQAEREAQVREVLDVLTFWQNLPLEVKSVDAIIEYTVRMDGAFKGAAEILQRSVGVAQ